MIGEPHTVPMKVTGKCGSVRVRLIPAPKGTGLVAAGTPKKLLQLAGVQVRKQIPPPPFSPSLGASFSGNSYSYPP